MDTPTLEKIEELETGRVELVSVSAENVGRAKENWKRLEEHWKRIGRYFSGNQESEM